MGVTGQRWILKLVTYKSRIWVFLHDVSDPTGNTIILFLTILLRQLWIVIYTGCPTKLESLSIVWNVFFLRLFAVYIVKKSLEIESHGRRHLKIFTNCRVSWDILFHKTKVSIILCILDIQGYSQWMIL